MIYLTTLSAAQSMWRQILIGFFFFFYSCCNHLEHRASVKRSVWLQFLNLRQSVGLLWWGISPSQGRYLTQTHNKHKQTSMLWVRFEPTILVFKRVKIFHVLSALTLWAPLVGLMTDKLKIMSKEAVVTYFWDIWTFVCVGTEGIEEVSEPV
jgi:hypothetical protein